MRQAAADMLGNVHEATRRGPVMKVRLLYIVVAVGALAVLGGRFYTPHA
jgi:hypothetical protein